MIGDNKERHCYVANGSIIPTATLDSGVSERDVDDVADQSRYIASLGLIILMIQFFLICLAGYHKVLAWLASLTFVIWLWYFIDMHRVRYSHAGQVCFGDFLLPGIDSGSPYLTSEGSFFRYMIIS